MEDNPKWPRKVDIHKLKNGNFVKEVPNTWREEGFNDGIDACIQAFNDWKKEQPSENYQLIINNAPHADYVLVSIKLPKKELK